MSLIYQVKSIEALYEAMKKIMIGKGTTITNFNVGSRIRTLLEAIATELHKSQYDYSKAMKTAIPLAVFNGFEFTREPGINATGKINFYRSGAAASDITIPIGTMILLDGVTFETTALGKILTGNTDSGGIASKCSTVGVLGNIAVNAIDTIAGDGSFINQPTGVENAKNGTAAIPPDGTAFTGGTDEESDEDRLARFREYVNSLARATPMGLVIGAKTVAGVISASIVENSPAPGWVTLYVDDGTGSLPAAMKTEVEKVINGDPSDPVNYPGYRAAGIQVRVLAPNLVNVNITMIIEIIMNSLVDDTQLEDEVETAVTNYVNTLTLGYDVTRTEIIKVAKNVHSDIFDIILTNPATNIIVGASSVARINTFAISSVRINP